MKYEVAMISSFQLRWVGSLAATALLLAFVLAPARAAAATDCSGSWRFDVGRPPADAEVLLVPESWCRGAKLPPTFAVDVRPGADGTPNITGTPPRPTDVTYGAARCGFEFAGPKNSAHYYELSIEVNAAGTAIEGKARCSERTRRSEEKSTGITIELPVTGSRSPAVGSPVSNPPVPASSGSDKVATAVVAACQQRDAEALWKLMTPRLQSDVDNRAAQVRQAAGSDLRRLYGYKGRPADFKGLAYLRTTINGEDSATNLCWRVHEWKLRPAFATTGGYLVPVARGDFAMGLTFTKNDRGWQLDQMSKWRRVPKP